MTLPNTNKSYNCILIFTNLRNKVDFQLLAYSYAQFLKQLGAVNLTATTKVNYELTYPIKKMTDVKFVEFTFSISPKALKAYQDRLRVDESILRSFLTVID
jgi:ribosomal protein S6